MSAPAGPLAASLAPDASGRWRLTLRLLNRWSITPGTAALLAACCLCLATAIAAPMGVAMMPAAEPYLGATDLAADAAAALPVLALILASLLLVPISITVVVVRLCAPPRGGDSLWESSARLRLAMAATLALPIPALALAAVGLLGLMANPTIFASGAAPLPAWFAWLFPAAIFSSIVALPTIWTLTLRAAWRSLCASMVSAEPACAACGYSLAGLPGATCPECGSVAPAAMMASRAV